MKNHISFFIKISSILIACIFLLNFSIKSFAMIITISWNDGYWTYHYNGGTRKFYLNNGTFNENSVYVCAVKLTNTAFRGNTIVLAYSNNSFDCSVYYEYNGVYRSYSSTLNSYNAHGLYSKYYSYTQMNFINQNIPYIGEMTLDDALLYLSQTLDDLGYIQNVGYHVDAYGLENNPIGTNELISWGQYSTTDIDLSDSRYKVEFALRDTSTMVSKNMYQSFLNQFPKIGVNLGFVSFDAMQVVDFLALSGQHLISNVFPYGSDDRAVLKGQAVRTDLYGKVTSLGTFSAASRRASLNCFSAYKNYYSDMTSNDAFSRYINSVGSSPTRNDFYNNAYDYFKSYGANYHVSYDIMARIVDSVSGNKGEWISINKHNTPYIDSDRSDRLDGGVTCTTGITMGDTVINEGDFVAPNIYAPSYVENEGDSAIYLPTRITVGYVDNSNSSSTVTNNYNNFEYNYGDTFIYNEYPNVGVDTNDDGEVTYTNDGDAKENINHAIRIFKYIWQKYTTWFNKLFSPWLPDWATHLVIISLPISFTGILFKIAKTILPLLGNLAQMILEIGSGLFLPGA